MRQSRVSIIDKVGAGEPKGHHKRTDRHPSKKVVCLVMVKVIGIDDQGKVKVSRKALLPPPEGGDKNSGRGPRRHDK